MSYITSLKMDSKTNMGQCRECRSTFKTKRLNTLHICRIPSPTIFHHGAKTTITINSILIVSLNHVLAIFKNPTTITNKIDAMVARFFWSSQNTKGIHWWKKEIIHLTRGMGGLGIRSVEACNQVHLIMEKVWRIHNNPQLLLAKVVLDQCTNPSTIHSPETNKSRGLKDFYRQKNSYFVTMHGMLGMAGILERQIINGWKGAFHCLKILHLWEP